MSFLSVKKQTVAAWIWLIILVGAALLGGLRLAKKPWLETQFWALLPQIKKDPVIQIALDRLSASQQKKAFWALGHRDSEMAQRAFGQALETVRAASFLKVSPLPDPEKIQQSFQELYFPFRYQMLSAADLKILNGDNPSEHFAQRLKSFLYGPMAGLGIRWVADDPLLLFFQQFSGWKDIVPQSDSSDTIERSWQEEGLKVEADQKTYYVFSADIDGDPFSQNLQERLVLLDKQVRQKILAAAPDSEILSGGIWRFAERERSRMQWELNFLGSVATVAGLILFWKVFGSLRQLAMTFVVLFIGIGSGLLACVYGFGQIHAVVLLFGTSLIGVGIDYSLHYFAHQQSDPDFRLASIAPGLILGAFTSVLGFLALAFVPFPVLQQMAVFSSVGLIVTLLTIFLWFPALHFPRGKINSKWIGKIVLKTEEIGPQTWQRFPRAARAGLFVFLLFIGTGIFRLRTDDSLLQFQKPPADLLETETKLRRFLNIPSVRQLVVVWGSTAEELLQRQENLYAFLQEEKNVGLLKSVQSLAPFLPSRARQKKEGTLLREKFFPEANLFAAKLSRMGFDNSVGQKLSKNLSKPVSNFFSWEEWLKNPATNFLSPLWLGETPQGWAAVCLLQEVSPAANFSRLLSLRPGVRYVDPVELYTEILRSSRQRSLVWGTVAYALIFFLMIVRYGLRLGSLLMLPCIMASAMTLSILGWLGFPFNLIHSLGLLLVLSLGVDYAIFFGEVIREGKGRSAAMAELAITLSALTTILSFGLFLFCRTLVLRALGLTVSLGILWTFLGVLVTYAFLVRSEKFYGNER